MSEPAKVPADVPAPTPVVMPAASVILIRDGASGLEVLMLRRTAKASFAPDAWVFPGGRIDPGDGADGLSLESARVGAARETQEEAGVAVDARALIPYSQWCPPPESPKRFLTWFFVVADDDAGEVIVDGGEITEHEWVRPAEAIVARDEGRIGLLPPTWLTLWELAHHDSTESVLSGARARTPPYYETHIGFLARADDSAKQDVIAMWEGDAGYDPHDPAAPGARHRLRMGEPPWRYERSF